jgi:hypothetical protein
LLVSNENDAVRKYTDLEPAFKINYQPIDDVLSRIFRLS